jgi:hypothetical protein
MAAQSQTFASHRRFFPLFHFFAFPILAINVFVAVWQLVQAPSKQTLWWVVVSLALASLALASRASTLIVQNRLIGLEMRLRLSAVLPPELRGRIGELTLKQIIGLRFASDGEIAGLVQRCLGGELTTADEVKRQVRDWRPDFVRA